MVKRLAAIAVTMIMSLFVLALGANPASAGECLGPCLRTTVPIAASVPALPPPGTCVNSSVGGYGAASFSTSLGYEYIPSHTAGYCETMVALPNQWSSLYNNTGRTIRVYKDTFCGGDYLQLASGDSHKGLVVSHPTLQDHIESVKFLCPPLTTPPAGPSGRGSLHVRARATIN